MAEKKKKSVQNDIAKNEEANNIVLNEDDEKIETYNKEKIDERKNDALKNKVNAVISGSFFTKIKQNLNPINVGRYIARNIWKPIVTFIGLFAFLLGGVYAGGYFNLFNAKEALNFEPVVAQLRTSTNPVMTGAMPVIEWTSSALGAAGEIMDKKIEANAVEAKKQAEIVQAQKEAEETKAREEAEKKSLEESKQANLSPEEKKALENEKRSSEKEVKKETTKQMDEDLKKIAAERQKELNKRASRLANYFSTMKPTEAVDILKNMDDEEVIAILGRMEDDVASRILSGFEPTRAAGISKTILSIKAAANQAAKTPSTNTL